ncbi:MAG: hypothetical protein H5T86_12050 [Armatimonadetes bacterium]|nr:hypothetical protein [Armatimonadota bacterium]
MIDAADLKQLVEITESAAQLALRLQASALSRNKTDGTVVTSADLQVEEKLRSDVEAAFGAVPILGEENGGRVTGAGTAVVIDPIDGTATYVRGSPIWAVSLGLLVDGRAAAGVVAAPAMGRTWAGAAGVGASHNGRPVRARPVHLGRNALIAATSEAVRRYGGPPSSVGHLRCFGAVAVQIAMCADGEVDVAVCSDWKLWDVTGALAILLAAGGEVSCACDGSDASNLLAIRPNADLVAGGPDVHRLVPRPIPLWQDAG